MGLLRVLIALEYLFINFGRERNVAVVMKHSRHRKKDVLWLGNEIYAIQRRLNRTFNVFKYCRGHHITNPYLATPRIAPQYGSKFIETDAQNRDAILGGRIDVVVTMQTLPHRLRTYFECSKIQRINDSLLC